MLKPGTKIGILGGGQLARMLALRAYELGLEPWVFCKANETPARSVTPHQVLFEEFNESTLANFLNQVDLCTFESEFIDSEIIKKAQAKTKTLIYPHPQIMSAIRDRKTQKELLLKYKIPTAKHLPVDSNSSYEQCKKSLGPQFILKQRLFGYDGYGTFIIKNKDDFNRCLTLKNNNFIGESFIKFKRELAFMAFRSVGNDVLFFPLVETKQQNSRCLWVKGPLKNSKVLPIQKKVTQFMQQQNYIGALGVELFDTGNELLVNELAPRVHNSAHYSQDALSLSQFDYHLLAPLQKKLPSFELKSKGFAMYNLLGSGEKNISFNLKGSIKLHWYQKVDSAKGRKMGHLNATGSTPELALKKILKLRKDFKL